jgi:hypothetical protein
MSNTDSSGDRNNWARPLSYLSLIVNIFFYIFIFLMVKDIAYSFSSKLGSEIFQEGLTGVVSYLWGKVRGNDIFHILYIITLIVGLINSGFYFFKRRSSLPSFIKLKFDLESLSSPTCTSALYFIVFLIGIYFSVTSSAINSWITAREAMSLGTAKLFSYVIATLFMSIIIFLLNQIALGKRRKQEEQKNMDAYQSKIDQLENIIRLAPPNGFAKNLSHYVDVADDFVQIILKRNHNINNSIEAARAYFDLKNPKDIFKGIEFLKTKIFADRFCKNKSGVEKIIGLLEEAQNTNAQYIRAILVSYARLAALFDGVVPSRKDKNIYRANLMLKYSKSDKKMPELSDFRYVPSVLVEQGGAELQHYLTLHEEHSVQVYSEKVGIAKRGKSKEVIPVQFEPDSDIKSFSLPFFLEESQKNYNCFGAPRAVADVECQFINDTIKEIDNWRESQESPREIIDEASKYFGRRDIAKSIISMPLMHSRYDEDHKLAKNVMGVVNIYRDKKNLMMGNTEKQEQFEYITTPLNFALSKIVAHDMVYRYYGNILSHFIESECDSDKGDVTN